MNEQAYYLQKITCRLGWILFLLLLPYFAVAFWFGAALLVAFA